MTSGEAGGRLKAASEAEPQPHRGRSEELHQHGQVSVGGHRQGDHVSHQLTGCRPQYAGRTYSLLTTFPNKEITDDAATVSGAGLVGAAVLQRIK